MRGSCRFIMVLGVLAALLPAGAATAGPYEENARAGQKAMARGNLRSAEQAFRKAVEADPAQSLPHKYLADIAFRQGRPQDAAAEARKSLAIEPNDGDTHYNLGMYLLYAAKMQPNDEVVSELKRAAELNPRDAQALSNLGAAFFLMKRNDEAVAALQRATKITPFWAPYWANLGEAELAAGHVEQAVAAFAAAAESRRLGLLAGEEYRSTFGDIYLNWGKAELKRGLTANAQSYLRKVVDALSKHAPSQAKVEEAKQLLAEVDRRLKEEQEALRRQEEERKQKLLAEQKRREEEARQREEALKRKQEELKRQQEGLARRQEEERKRQQAEAERKRREEELRVQQEALRRQEEELKRKQQEEEAKRRQQEEEAKRRQQDTVAPVITIRDTGDAAAGAQSRDLVLVGTDEEEKKQQTRVIFGTASDNVAVVEVTVAGKPATLYQSRDLVLTEDLGFSADFSAEVAILPGENRIEVVATDRAGNRGKQVVVINGKTQETVEAIRNATEEVAKAAAQRYALIVGVSQYENPQIARPPSAAADARALHALLTDPQRARFAAGNVLLLTDGQADPARKPTRAGILDGLAWLEKSARPDDQVLVCFLGQGAQAKEGAPYLLPTDTRPDSLDQTAISMAELAERLARIPSGRKALLLDVHHAAALPKGFYGPILAAEGLAVLASCSGGEQPGQYAGANQGAVMHFLCEGLSGAADADRNGTVTLGEASTYVVKSVGDWARGADRAQTPLARMGDARFDVALTFIPATVEEQKKQKVLAAFDDERVRNLALSLLEKESKALTDKESLALMALEQVLSGESRKEVFLNYVERLNLL